MSKWFSSDWATSLVLNGVSGSLNGIMKAVLSDGFGSKSVTSLVIASGVATVTVSGGHIFIADIVVKIAGAVVTGGTVNGEQRVKATGINTISFNTALADQTATGTITIEVASLGWTKKFTGTNKTVFQSAQVDGTGFCVRVDDSGGDARSARVVGYEVASDIDTGVRAFPTEVQQPGGLWWDKSSAANSTAVPWFIFGDEYRFYFCCSPASASGVGHIIRFFGDLKARRVGDPYACVLVGGEGSGGQSQNSGTSGKLGDSGNSIGGNWLARSYSGLSSPITSYAVAGSQTGAIPGRNTSGRSGTGSVPNGPDNGVILTKLLSYEPTGLHWRGTYPGIFHMVQTNNDLFLTGAVIDGEEENAGHKLMAVRVEYNGTAGAVFFDITGPWG